MTSTIRDVISLDPDIDMAEFKERELLPPYTRHLYAEEILGTGVPQRYGLPFEAPIEPLAIMENEALTECISDAAGYLHLYVDIFNEAYIAYQSAAGQTGTDTYPTRRRLAAIRHGIIAEWNFLMDLQQALEPRLVTPTLKDQGIRTYNKQKLVPAADAPPTLPGDAPLELTEEQALPRPDRVTRALEKAVADLAPAAEDQAEPPRTIPRT